MGQPLVTPTPPPDPLPTLRPRRLTIPRQPDPDFEAALPREIEAQQQSPLFATLPLEVRRLIYHHIVGGQTIHMMPTGARVGHVKCLREGKQKWSNGPCENCWSIIQKGPPFDLRSHHGGMLPLLKTCRMVYSEAIDIMYSDNDFQFIDMEHLIHWSTTFLPKRHDAIRSIQLWMFFLSPHPLYSAESIADPMPPQDEATWESLCETVGSMQGLQELRVELLPRDWCASMRPEYEEKLLEPLWHVKSSKVWQFVVHWPSTGIILDGAPFQMITEEGPLE